MKTTPSIILNVVLAAALAVVSIQLAKSRSAGGADASDTTATAQTQGEFKEFDPTKDFSVNPFTFFTGNGLLLAAGDSVRSNAMTIGWGSLGNIWDKGTSTITVFVAQQRFTHGFMERSKYFTVRSFDDAHKQVLEYKGSHSGRDGDKAQALGLHTLYTEHGTPYYAEASQVFECELIYHTQLDSAAFGDLPRNFYKDYTAGIHSAYVGRIVKAMKK